MRRTVNKGVIYTGKVGARMRPSFRGMFSTKRVVKKAFKLIGGPFSNCTVFLDAFGGANTLPICAKGMAGAYVKGKWSPA